MLIGSEVYHYDVSRMLVVSVDLPVASQVTRANHAEPFLCLRLNLDPHKIAELILLVSSIMSSRRGLSIITKQRLYRALHQRAIFHGGWYAATSEQREGCRMSVAAGRAMYARVRCGLYSSRPWMRSSGRG